NGAYGDVYCANWKNKGCFALKSFKNHQEVINEIVKEFKLHRNVNYHENIIRLFGIAMEEPNVYSLVLEYADNDTLKGYLNKHFSELNWNDKFRLAFQLSSAVECLYDENIIHRDLQSLVYQGKLQKASIPYVDPKLLNDKCYTLNKKSDVYSVGVLLWQLSSGRSPFYDDAN
ncbi:3880_t:CDS:2, partial [Funneliformis geosporum]